MLLNILQCTGEIPTTKNHLAQDVHSTYLEKLCSWPPFFILLESGNIGRHQDLTWDQARCSIWPPGAQSALALQTHQLWLPLLLVSASCLSPLGFLSFLLKKNLMLPLLQMSISYPCLPLPWSSPHYCACLWGMHKVI